MMPKKPRARDDDDERAMSDEESAALEAAEARAEQLVEQVSQLRLGARGREPKTMGDKIAWIRSMVGPRDGKAMSRDDFALLIGKLSGEDARDPTTFLKWEANQGRGPTLREGVAMVRLVGKTCEWLASLDEHLASNQRIEQDAQRLEGQPALSAAKAEAPTRAVPRTDPQSRARESDRHLAAEKPETRRGPQAG